MSTAIIRAATTKKGASGSCLDKRTCFHFLRCIDNKEEEEQGSFESFRLFEVIHRQLMRSMCLPPGLDRQASFECKQDALACTLPCVSEIESCIGGEILFLLSKLWLIFFQSKHDKQTDSAPVNALYYLKGQPEKWA
ncbi:unnamed protein product [Ixodes pacificus]